MATIKLNLEITLAVFVKEALSAGLSALLLVGKVFMLWNPNLQLLLACLHRYPVILSIENHCSIVQQKKMAQYLTEILGDKLDLSSVHNDDSTKLPSPASLKGKILVKVNPCFMCPFPPFVMMMMMISAWLSLYPNLNHFTKSSP